MQEREREKNAILELFCILNKILEPFFQQLGLHFVPGQISFTKVHILWIIFKFTSETENVLQL